MSGGQDPEWMREAYTVGMFCGVALRYRLARRAGARLARRQMVASSAVLRGSVARRGPRLSRQ